MKSEVSRKRSTQFSIQAASDLQHVSEPLPSTHLENLALMLPVMQVFQPVGVSSLIVEEFREFLQIGHLWYLRCLLRMGRQVHSHRSVSS